MISPSNMSISETVWYGETNDSPSIPSPNGLVFRPVPAQSDKGPTVAIFSGYHLGSPYLEYYGGQIPRAVWTIAINNATGLVYHSDLSDPYHPPISLEASDQEIDKAPPGWSTESGAFNLDLCQLLGLPAQGATYRVFLWLDDVLSNVETIGLPADPARGTGYPSAPKAVATKSTPIGPVTTKLRPGGVALTPSGEANSDKVTVHWHPLPSEDPKSTGLWLLAWSHRDREFQWLGITANEVGAAGSPASFELSISEFIEMKNASQKGFMVGVTTTGISNALTVKWP